MNQDKDKDKVKRVELTEELINKYGIIDIYYNSEKIEIIFTNNKGNEDLISLPVMKYGSDSIKELDALVNGSMSLDAYSRLKWYLSLKLLPIWDQIYISNSKTEEHEHEHDQEKERVTKAAAALETANKTIKKLSIDEYQTAHAVISVKDHLETLHLSSQRFRNYLASETFKQKGILLESQGIKDIVGILSARAEFDSGDPIPIRLNLRIAQIETEGGLTWYYDLTNKEWEFIEITANGWKIVKNQDPNLVLFHRYNNQLAQVYPSREYDPNILDRFVELVLNETNVKDKDKLEEYRILLKCYMICAFIADVPKVILMPHGGQGAAKTSLFELVKDTIDPSSLTTLTLPTGMNEFIQQLSHNLVAFYDNVSSLKDWQSDQICRASTGAASSKRLLYSDDDDFIRSFIRSIGLNGINLAATKPDILDRGLFFELIRIADEKRRYIKKVRKEFEAIKPQLLGYIFDILVKVIARIQSQGMLELDRLPRMADWAGYCEIIARCIGLPDGKFIEAYTNNAKIQVEQVMETSELALRILLNPTHSLMPRIYWEN
jgi:hypothetical protein